MCSSGQETEIWDRGSGSQSPVYPDIGEDFRELRIGVGCGRGHIP